MAKHNYSSFKATDFLLDEHFCRWMKSGDPALELFWNDWLARHPQRRCVLENAQMLFRSLQFSQKPLSRQTIDAEWARLQSAINADQDSPAKAVSGRPSGKWGQWLAAASVLLLVISGIGYFYLYPGAFTANHTVEKTALRGQRIDLLLPDGTRVLLNSGSIIRYPEDFAPDKREVTLEGQAFFEVAPDPYAPFLIASGEVTTEVVGTSFGIEAYPEQASIRVAVVSGKVNVYSAESTEKNTKVTLTPNQMATFENSGRAFVVSPFEQDKQLAWVDGVLYFDKADFRNVISELENWYGVTIVTEPGLQISEELLLTGKFKNKPLEYVLDSYRYPERFSYQVKNDTILIQQPTD